MAQLCSKFNKTNISSTPEARISSMESFLQSFTEEVEYLLGNLTLKNFSSATVDLLKNTFDCEIKTGVNNLAEFNNGLKIQWGNLFIIPESADTCVTKTIVFNKAFTSPPSISVTPYTSVPQNVFCSYTDRNTKEFKLLLCRNDTTPTTVSWIAIGI